MKSRESANKLRDLSVDELQRRAGEMNEKMFHLRFQWAMGQTDKLNDMRELRRDKARLLTIMREKENG